ncbi:MAG: sigma-70 family RNA polymerase sigma factor [Actinomycetota bacterium]|nr:sigma-70 family RNA polymerase sigma factor [Actinomycetota bacterium]
MAELDSSREALVRTAYERHGGELYRFGYAWLDDAGAAQDAVQEVVVRAWRAADRFDPAVGSLRTWLYAIARNVVRDQGRARRSGPGVDPIRVHAAQGRGKRDQLGVLGSTVGAHGEVHLDVVRQVVVELTENEGSESLAQLLVRVPAHRSASISSITARSALRPWKTRPRSVLCDTPSSAATSP